LATVEGWFVVPFDTVAQMENISRVVRRFPAFGQIRLYREGARPHLRADLMPHQPAVDETQRGVRLEAKRLMRIEVHWVPSTHTQDAAALGLARFGTPERGRMREGQSRQRDTSRQASFEHITTVHTLRIARICLRYLHRKPSLV